MSGASLIGPSTQNRLLDSLPQAIYQRLRPELKAVHLSRGKTICEADDWTRYVYFPVSGVITLLLTTGQGETIEAAVIGNEGTTGVPVLMHSRRMPYRAVVQVPVDALRVEASFICGELKEANGLNDVLLCYEYSLLTQVAQSVVCSRFHTSDQRLCRWLLSIRDRVPTDTLELTQEALSYLLGVQRSMVGASACELQRAGMISYGRGSITILDRQGLEAAACECYAIVKDQICQCLFAKPLTQDPSQQRTPAR